MYIGKPTLKSITNISNNYKIVREEVEFFTIFLTNKIKKTKVPCEERIENDKQFPSRNFFLTKTFILGFDELTSEIIQRVVSKARYLTFLNFFYPKLNRQDTNSLKRILLKYEKDIESEYFTNELTNFFKILPRRKY